MDEAVQAVIDKHSPVNTNTYESYDAQGHMDDIDDRVFQVNPKCLAGLQAESLRFESLQDRHESQAAINESIQRQMNGAAMTTQGGLGGLCSIGDQSAHSSPLNQLGAAYRNAFGG